MRKGPFKVDSWVEKDAIWFECPICREVDQIKVMVECTHSPARCIVCGKKFQVDVIAEVVVE